MPDEKVQTFLLFLTSEEKKRAQEHIAQRLRMLDAENLQSIDHLMASTKKSIGPVQTGRAGFERASNRYAEVMRRLYDEALIGFAQLLQQCNRAYTAKEREMKSIQRAQVAGSTGQTEAVPLEEQSLSDGLRALLLKPTADEEATSLDYIQKRVQEMEIADLALCRDATQRLLTWWESAQGQAEGLMLNQFGESSSVKGRRVVREKYEKIQQEVLNPFKLWFQNLNTVYLRRRKELTESAARGAPRRA